ncbi:MAG: nitrate reductase cytochrome c-type subunit [Halioglobus sp.]
MKSRITTTVLLGLALTAGALAQNVATTRDAALDVEPNPPKISRVENDDVKRKRAYPMQPPTVPHKIDNYQVDTNANKCMSCHSRRRTQESQAPMVSVTHYMDRDGNFLADISARRYFCNQCHVVQRDVDPLLDNEFEDIDELLRAARR